MIKEAMGVAPTIDEARKLAVANLNAPVEADVKVEIVEMPKKKTLGLFGGSSAKVKAYYDDGKAEPKPAEEKPAVKKEMPKTEKKPQPQKKAEPKASAPKKDAPKKDAPKKETVAEPEVDLTAIEEKETSATNYLKSILVGMGFKDAVVTVKETGEDLFFEITCEEDYGNIIGRRGETLDALQYLTRLFVTRSENDSKRVSLNVGDYRKRRAETLKSLAKRQAQRSLKYGRNSVLEPMNPYERRIIHTAIQEIEGVSSHSVGEGDSRRVVITADNARGGYNNRDNRDNRDANRGGDRRNGGHGGDRREKRPPYVPEASDEPREHKSDVAASSRYGKIEPKFPAAAKAPTAEATAPAEEKTEE